MAFDATDFPDPDSDRGGAVGLYVWTHGIQREKVSLYPGAGCDDDPLYAVDYPKL